MNEGEQTVLVLVRVHTYGKPDKVHDEVVNAVGRLMNREFKGRFELLLGGEVWRYDALAADGNHEGHDEVWSKTRLRLGDHEANVARREVVPPPLDPLVQ